MSRDQYPNGSGSSNRSLFANLNPQQDYPKTRALRENNLQNLAPEPALEDDEDYEIEEEQEEEYEENNLSMNQQQIPPENDIIAISDSDSDEEHVNGLYHNNNNNNNNNNYEVRCQNNHENQSDESNDCEIVMEYNDANAQRTRDPRMTILDIEIEEASRISTNGTVNYLLLNIEHNL